MSQFETVIGLEVHLQLNTKTKIFCSCANQYGCAPNTNVCPVCLGLPGTLPVLNHQVLLSGIKAGLALNAQINSFIKFDRKNYYYPDLPKGYQISQYDFPIAKHGFLTIKTQGQEKRIGITRAHLEEDAGKLVHDNAGGCSLVDFNRTGTPLIEIVTEPDMRSPQEAYDYLNTLKLTLQYLGISDCDMEKGSLRCDANVSIRPVGQTTLGTKTELKNMNSFRAVKLALEYEVRRHEQVITAGGKIVQETLLWNDEKAMTITMRSKEQAHDYRYFPDPDLVPFTIDQKVIDDVRAQLPELPQAKFLRFLSQYGLSEYDAQYAGG
jgi:aspartyl-tRNA(Asn)/glutamyl-tRNA(Gln) amidotransferase subunit B